MTDLSAWLDDDPMVNEIQTLSEKILSYDNQYCADELDEGEMEESQYD